MLLAPYGSRYRRGVHPPARSPGARRRCTCAPTPAASAATWPSSPTRRWPAGSTSSSCGTRARPASSGSGRWRRARSWRRWRCSPMRRAGTARCSRSTTAPTSRVAAGADVLHLGQDDLPLRDRPRHRRPAPADRPVHPRPRPGRRRGGRGGRLLLRRPVLADPDQAGPPGARPGPGPRRRRTAQPDKPWFAIGGIDAQRLPEVLAAGRPPDRRGAGDHRGRRSAGRGATAESSRYVPAAE